MLPEARSVVIPPIPILPPCGTIHVSNGSHHECQLRSKSEQRRRHIGAVHLEQMDTQRCTFVGEANATGLVARDGCRANHPSTAQGEDSYAASQPRG